VKITDVRSSESSLIRSLSSSIGTMSLRHRSWYITASYGSWSDIRLNCRADRARMAFMRSGLEAAIHGAILVKCRLLSAVSN